MHGLSVRLSCAKIVSAASPLQQRAEKRDLSGGLTHVTGVVAEHVRFLEIT